MVIYTRCQIHSDLILSSFLYSFLWNCHCLCLFNVIVILVVIVIVTLFVIVLFPWLMSISCNCICLFQNLFVISSMKFSSCSIDQDTVCLFLTITLWIWLTITTTIQGFKRMVFKKLGKGHYSKINAFARCQTDTFFDHMYLSLEKALATRPELRQKVWASTVFKIRFKA